MFIIGSGFINFLFIFPSRFTSYSFLIDIFKCLVIYHFICMFSNYLLTSLNYALVFIFYIYRLPFITVLFFLVYSFL